MYEAPSKLKTVAIRRQTSLTMGCFIAYPADEVKLKSVLSTALENSNNMVQYALYPTATSEIPNP